MTVHISLTAESTRCSLDLDEVPIGDVVTDDVDAGDCPQCHYEIGKDVGKGDAWAEVGREAADWEPGKCGPDCWCLGCRLAPFFFDKVLNHLESDCGCGTCEKARPVLQRFLGKPG